MQDKETGLSLQCAWVRGQPEGHICSKGKFFSTSLRLSFSPNLLVAYTTNLNADSFAVRFGVSLRN